MNKAVSPSASGSLVDVTFADVAPSWDALAARVAERKTELGMPLEVDLEKGPTNPHALIRRFGTTEEPRVLFYRDHAAWCPYCQKIWMQLEEKRIPYKVERCVEINQCVGCARQFFTKSFLGDGAAVLARSSGEEPASPRHRAGVASMERAVKF